MLLYKGTDVIFFFPTMPLPVLPCGSTGKESACRVGDLGSIPGLGRPSGEWKGYPLQYFGLENSMDCIIHGVAKSQTWLSNFHFHATTAPRQIFRDGTFRVFFKKPNLSTHFTKTNRYLLRSLSIMFTFKKHKIQ